jgi:hypothetical protein
MNIFGQQFSPEEEEEFGDMARSENFYEKFAASVAPSIYGSIGNLVSQYLTLAGADMIVPSLRRHKEGDHLFVVWRIPKTAPRWDEVEG